MSDQAGEGVAELAWNEFPSVLDLEPDRRAASGSLGSTAGMFSITSRDNERHGLD
jgi:hypothetical protein